MPKFLAEEKFNDLVNKMTNHERNQWARASYPSLIDKDVEQLLPHAQAAYRRLTDTYMILGQPGLHPKHPKKEYQDALLR